MTDTPMFQLGPLTLQHVERGLRRLAAAEQLQLATAAQPEGVRYDPLATTALLNTARRLTTSIEDATDAIRLIDITSFVVIGCATFNIALEPWLSRKVGLFVIESLLEQESWQVSASEHEIRDLNRILSAVPPSPTPVPEPVVEWVRDWMLGALVNSDCYTLASVMGIERRPEPVRCFIACAMTTASDLDVEDLLGTSESIARILSTAGVLCYQPLRVHDPRVSRAVADNPYNRVLNERQIAGCDLVLIVADRPATGLGVVDTLALKYGALVVVAKGDQPVTPMLIGTVPEPKQFDLGPDFLIEFHEYIVELLPVLQMNAVERFAAQQLAAAELDDIRARLATLDERQVTSPPRISMDRARFQQIISDADLFDGASHREHRQLRSLISGVELPPLSLDQARALFHAEVEAGWPRTLTPSIEIAGRTALARGGRQRFEPTSTRFWIHQYNQVKST